MRDQALLARERRIEAEALIENVKARIRYSQPQTATKFGLLLLLLGLNLTLAVAQQTAPRQPDVKFVPTPRAAVRKMLKLASVKPGDVVYDLGCGDGRMVITAAKRYGVRGVGIDIDPERIRQSRKNARKAGVGHLVSFRNEDLFDADISEGNGRHPVPAAHAEPEAPPQAVEGAEARRAHRLLQFRHGLLAARKRGPVEKAGAGAEQGRKPRRPHGRHDLPVDNTG